MFYKYHMVDHRYQPKVGSSGLILSRLSDQPKIGLHYNVVAHHNQLDRERSRFSAAICASTQCNSFKCLFEARRPKMQVRLTATKWKETASVSFLACISPTFFSKVDAGAFLPFSTAIIKDKLLHYASSLAEEMKAALQLYYPKDTICCVLSATQPMKP